MTGRAAVTGREHTSGDASAMAQAPVREGASLLALFAWTGFALLLLYAILLGGGWIGIYAVSIRVLSLAIVAAGLTTWLIVAWRRPEWRPSTAIWPAFALPLAAFAISVATSPFPRLGLDYLAWVVLLTALYLLLVRILARPYARARIGGLAAVLAMVLGGAYVVMAVILWSEWWGLVGELRVPPLRPMYLSMPWGGPSAVMTVQVLLTAAAAGGLGFATRSARVVVSVLVVLMAVVSLVSGSRSGWLAVAAATVIVGGIWLLRSARWSAFARSLRSRRSSVVLVLLSLGVLAAALGIGPTVLSRFSEGGDGGRPVYWATALRMIVDSPVVGLGPGNWAARRIVYTESGELDFTIPHAHDQVLETGAEFGLVGLAAGAIALACLAWLLYVALRGPDEARRRWAWAGTFGLLYLAVATVVDSYTFPAILVVFAIPIATLDATSPRRIGLPRQLAVAGGPLRVVAIGALAVACVAAVIHLARAESVALTHEQAVQAANQTAWELSLGPALEAAEAEPGLAPYQVTAGLAAAGTGDWETAEIAFRAAAAIDDLPASWLGLALAESELGRPAEQVEASLSRAMRLGEQQPAITFASAQLYDRLGMTAASDDAFVKVLAGIPSLASDEGWAAILRAPGRLEALVDRAIRAAPQAGWEIALMAGDLGRARGLLTGGDGGASLADSPSSDLDAFRVAVIDAWSGDTEALATVQSDADGHPMDAGRLAWAARLSDRAGDPEAAQRYRRLVDLGIRGAAQGVEVRIGERLPTRDAALGTGTYYYGNYLYRRTTPVDLIVPGLPGLVIAEDANDP